MVGLQFGEQLHREKWKGKMEQRSVVNQRVGVGADGLNQSIWQTSWLVLC